MAPGCYRPPERPRRPKIATATGMIALVQKGMDPSCCDLPIFDSVRSTGACKNVPGACSLWMLQLDRGLVLVLALVVVICLASG
jgi:hypothetical protein